jgi:hypothetical protein
MADEVIDARGRVLQLRKLSVLDRLRLFEAAGAELSRNDRWLGLAVLAASVGVIDGVPVPLPASKAGIEAAVQRLDEAGLAAVAAGLQPEPAFDRALAGN